MANKPAFYMALVALNGSLDGEDVEIAKGTVVDAQDPALKKWPDSFGPLVTRRNQPEVEQATAAPGEKRGA